MSIPQPRWMMGPSLESALAVMDGSVTTSMAPSSVERRMMRAIVKAEPMVGGILPTVEKSADGPAGRMAIIGNFHELTSHLQRGVVLAALCDMNRS